ncbi:hypothetical protein EXIGLDRAFT_771324 [Exidia glandulosa HHB12029]|uniref:DUF6533 domain-containing protein n=1 Tax=Exidia glandulosa HHB12029 TaxID=1314781 RepID=A0A165G265_EXIGL|nr:hypothetical protein EXIGLDRAFT_771324 [Exidia glandulosa HHB12029]
MSSTTTGWLIPVAGFIRIAALTLFVHDWVLTFKDEVDLIWRRRWTRATATFLIIRYLSLSILVLDAYVGVKTGINRQTCMRYGIVASSCSIVVLVLVQGVLQLRLYLMYNRDRKLMWINIVLYTIQIVVWLVVLNVLTRNEPQFSGGLRIPPYVMGSCYHIIDSERTAIGWLPSLIFELWMMLQAVYRVWREPKLRGPSILASLVRDSVLYFGMMVGILTASIVLYRINPVDPGYAASGLVTASAAIGGTRIIISMRYVLTVPTEDPTLATDNNTVHVLPRPIELQVVSNATDYQLSPDRTRYSQDCRRASTSITFTH